MATSLAYWQRLQAYWLGHAQHGGGQVVAMHVGAQQKAAYAEDAVQVLAVLLGIPADPLVSITQLQGRSTE